MRLSNQKVTSPNVRCPMLRVEGSLGFVDGVLDPGGAVENCGFDSERTRFGRRMMNRVAAFLIGSCR